jgi:hypothetical protein
MVDCLPSKRESPEFKSSIPQKKKKSREKKNFDFAISV